MKTKIFYLIILALILINTFKGQAQSVTKGADGIYQTTGRTKTQAAGTDTGKKYKTATNEILSIFQTEKGKFYVIRTSKKTNKIYKQYLTIN